MTGRAERVAAAIKGELAMLLLREVKDPRVEQAGLVTVTQVEVTRDLRLATVLVSFAGADLEAATQAIAALSRLTGYLRGELARRLTLRRAPDLRFVHDRSAEYAAHIDALLKDDK